MAKQARGMIARQTTTPNLPQGVIPTNKVGRREKINAGTGTPVAGANPNSGAFAGPAGGTPVPTPTASPTSTAPKSAINKEIKAQAAATAAANKKLREGGSFEILGEAVKKTIASPSQAFAQPATTVNRLVTPSSGGSFDFTPILWIAGAAVGFFLLKRYL